MLRIEKIRQMTDEELAEFLSKLAIMSTSKPMLKPPQRRPKNDGC